MDRYFQKIAAVGTGNYNYVWKSKGLSNENIAPRVTSNYSLTP